MGLSIDVVCFIQINLGLGHHIWSINPPALSMILKLLFLAHFIWGAALYLCRESALLSFRRVFPRNNSSRVFNFVLYAIHGLNTAWFIYLVVGTILRCDLVARNWNLYLLGKCNLLRGFWLGIAIASFVIDLFILLLPMPTVWGLNITNKLRKLGLIGIFALGYL